MHPSHISALNTPLSLDNILLYDKEFPWQNDMEPTVSMEKISMDQVEYLYSEIRMKQFRLLEFPLSTSHPNFRKYCKMMKIFYNGRLISLQTHLNDSSNREFILREILTLIYDKIIRNYSLVSDPLVNPYPYDD